MLTAQEALGLILESVRPLSTENVPLAQTLNRVLSLPVIAPINLPPFDNSAMDGYAVGDLEGPFRVVGTIAAGDAALPRLSRGEACRIMTGAPIPQRTIAVVPFEEWPVSRTISSGDNIRRAGEDVRKGSKVLNAGDRITSRTIALLAALGVEGAAVFRKPRVHLLSTGSEIIPSGKPLKPGQIYNSNGPALVAALKEMGIDAETIGAASDAEDSLKSALSRMRDCDVLITVGGVSAGDFDLVPKVLKDLGAETVFHKVAIKPGKPLLFAHLGNTRIFGLPGNPVSSLMVFDRFVRPALLKMMGAKAVQRLRGEAVVEGRLKGSAGKEDYLRGIVEHRGGRCIARSAGPQGSAHLLPLARANAVLILPEDVPLLEEGDRVAFELLENV